MPTPGNEGRQAWKPPNISTDNSFLDSAKRFLRKTYAGDYLGLIVLVAIFIVIQLTAVPFHQMFNLNDPRIQHPHADHERVNIFFLFLYANIIPLVTLLAWTLVYDPDTHKARVACIGLLASIFSTIVLTDILKNAIGRPRPDLIARCKPEPSTPRDELVTIKVCTETSTHLLQDGWRSFPSGHSSFAFAGLGWVALFFASQTACLRPRASLIVVMLCIVPLIGAAMIAISRLEDYRHDVFDVISGSLLGFAMANLHWRRYFPSLLADDCSEPYGPQSGSGRQSPSGAEFQRVRDEEENLGERDLFGSENDRSYGLEGIR